MATKENKPTKENKHANEDKIVTLFATPEIPKLSDINIKNPRELSEYKSRLNMDMKKTALAKAAYQKVSQKLEALTKLHLNELDTKFASANQAENEDTNEVGVAIKFGEPEIFRKSVEGKSAEYMSSATDQVINYQFLMFRTIKGKDAIKLDGELFNDDGVEWNNLDVVKSFVYKSNKGELDSYDGEQGLVNPEALKLFKSEKTEAFSLVKKAFKAHLAECNMLKNTMMNQYIPAKVCGEFIDQANPDLAIKGLTCLETFSMALDNTLCPSIVRGADIDL